MTDWLQEALFDDALHAVAASSDAPGYQLGEDGSQPLPPLHSSDGRFSPADFARQNAELIASLPSLETYSASQESLFGHDYALPSGDYTEIVPELVRVDEVPLTTMVQYQRLMSRVVWRPGPGRNVPLFVRHGNDLLGLLFLASPVINMGPRDGHLGLDLLTLEERGDQLRHYADLCVCVSIQPAGWRWNLGKLLAMLAYTCGDIWQQKYGDELRGIVTTAVDGRGGGKSTQYDRVYKYLGDTQGYGTVHVTDAQVRAMRRRIASVTGLSSRHFGTGSGIHKGDRLNTINAYTRLFGGPGIVHGQKRAIYYHPTVDPSTRLDVVRHWHERWGLPRFLRKRDETPPYLAGRGGAKDERPWDQGER